MKNILKKFNWIYFVSRRFSTVDKRGRSAVTSFLAVLGIAFGVMALTVIVSVMNGLQMSYINSIMEISSYHVRVTPESQFSEKAFLDTVAQIPEISVVQRFYESQALVAGKRGKQQGALIRSVSADIMNTDAGFANEVSLISGSFDLTTPNSIVLGSSLAMSLGVLTGDNVTLLAVSGTSDVELIDDSRVFTVTGVFSCGYADINATFAFVSDSAGNGLLGANPKPIYGLKLKNSNMDSKIISILSENPLYANYESWRSYNRAFFGALRVEKNMLMMLIFIIFIVVGVNIFNGMRRICYERREEICVFSAVGGKKDDIMLIFTIQGALTGFYGALSGTILGLLLSVNVSTIFMLISKISYYVQYFFTSVFSPDSAVYVRQNMLYMVYAQIPAQINFSEVFVIALFGMLASLTASMIASRGILRLSCAEVLRDE